MARRKKRITNFEYDVCLSFAGEDRAYVNEVANSLTEKGVRVFYDEAELPDNIHINIDLLRRLTKFPVSKIKRIVGQIRSLGFYPLLRDADDTSHHFEPGQILVIEWYDLYSESTGNATEVVVAMIDAATNGYCEEHGLEALERLDFAQLASVTMREDIH